ARIDDEIDHSFERIFVSAGKVARPTTSWRGCCSELVSRWIKYRTVANGGQASKPRRAMIAALSTSAPRWFDRDALIAGLGHLGGALDEQLHRMTKSSISQRHNRHRGMNRQVDWQLLERVAFAIDSQHRAGQSGNEIPAADKIVAQVNGERRDYKARCLQSA